MSSPKISVVIPHMPFDGAGEMLKKCTASLECDELIIVVNDKWGYAKSVNQGLKVAKGDYICVVNNDTVCKGDLKDLCKSNTVCVPKMRGQVDNQPRAFFCMDRKVYEKIGGFDEQFETGYFEDDDFLVRLGDKNISIDIVSSVEVDHLGGATMKRLPNRQEIFDKNKKKFETKHGV